MYKRCIQAGFDGLIIREIQEHNRDVGMGPGLDIFFLPYRSDNPMPPIGQAACHAQTDAGRAAVATLNLALWYGVHNTVF